MIRAMVYLVGVDHLVQYDGPVPGELLREFMDFLVDRARSLEISCIAEEFSREALHDVYHATRATAREAARRLGIEHRFCDPEEYDLRALGIPLYGEIIDRIKERRGLPGGFILDDATRKSVEVEAAETARSFWPRREEFWFDRLVDIIANNILFVCGHEHAGRFRALIVDKGYQCSILTSFWREDIFSDYRVIGLA